MQNDFLGGFFWRQFARVDRDFCICWRFVRIGDAREFFQNSGARLGVQAFAIALLADIHRSGDMHEDETAMRFDHLPHMLASRIIRRDRRADGDATVLGDFRSNVSDAADVQIAMLFRESEFGRKILTNQVAIEQCYRTAADF
jgi:hypothetical protein